MLDDQILYYHCEYIHIYICFVNVNNVTAVKRDITTVVYCSRYEKSEGTTEIYEYKSQIVSYIYELHI